MKPKKSSFSSYSCHKIPTLMQAHNISFSIQGTILRNTRSLIFLFCIHQALSLFPAYSAFMWVWGGFDGRPFKYSKYSTTKKRCKYSTIKRARDVNIVLLFFCVWRNCRLRLLIFCFFHYDEWWWCGSWSMWETVLKLNGEMGWRDGWCGLNEAGLFFITMINDGAMAEAYHEEMWKSFRLVFFVSL